MPEFPMPGTKLLGKTVIASVIYSEDEDYAPNSVTVLLLGDDPPFYQVANLEARGDRWEIVMAASHMNIVHAVNGNPFPMPDPDRPGHMTGPHHPGYVDLGGEI